MVENMTPEIIFEDNHVLVAVKPAGVLSQADGSDAPDILNILKDYIKVKYDKPGNVYLGLLHRLDRNVEGIMVFAKTSKAASRISEQIRKHEVNKRYRAIVNGTFKNKEGRMSYYLLKDKKNNVTSVFDKDPGRGDAKLSSLSYKVTGEAEFNGKKVSITDIDLETGRSHQIRAFMSHEGHPLLGDFKYNDRTYKGDICLQSYLIGFKHPISGEYKEYTLPMKDQGPWEIFGGKA
jgi:23S rRNA pseudouridine1911/1915/1917 synthase